MYDFKTLQQKISEGEDWLRKEYQGLRTGRATPTLLDSIQIESYGSRIPLNQAANIGVEDARTLRVTPWDASQVKDIEKAITNANFGVGISTDDKGVRVSFPELTTERRTSLIKIGKEKLEDARQSLRGYREEAWGDIQTKEKNGEMSEDDKFGSKDELQKLIDAGNSTLEDLFKKKEEEISQ
ncbi:ribosome recycling factor [Candidatus Kaiserbacteria bacterium]|nr:MAG: ribosome recycling factor [Candidatus Kaiserbacteria bacterium]PCI90584.1 MAG: ribosome recycling factor [Candidatus Kaiserbacteria bacterium]